MEVTVNNIICIFTIKNGEIYVLVDNNKIPCISCDNEIDIINKNFISNLNIDLKLKQIYTFSEKNNNNLIFYILFSDIINYDLVKNLDLISLDEVKDNKFITRGLQYLKDNISNTKCLKIIFNREFALPELQKLLEKILNKKFDRRNFRKKLLNQNIIEEVDKTDCSSFGRPAKLYKFKENIKDIEII